MPSPKERVSWPGEWGKSCSSLRALSEGFLKNITPGLSLEGVEGVVQVKRGGEGCLTRSRDGEKPGTLGKLQVFHWLEHGTDLERAAGSLVHQGRAGHQGF